MREVDFNYIRQCLEYDPENGIFFWLERPRSHFKSDRGFNVFNTKYANKKAGSGISKKNSKTKYEVINLSGVAYHSHHLVWLYEKGSMPNNTIDHIDGNGLNNKIFNLRDVPMVDNLKNRPICSRNKYGIIGVRFRSCFGKWNSRIGFKNKLVDLGYFDDLFEACCARKSAEIKLGFHPNHGRAN